MPGSAKGRKRQAPTSGDTEEEKHESSQHVLSTVDENDITETQGPDTIVGQFIDVITTAITAVKTPAADEAGSMKATLLKRRIASCPTMTETDTTDHVKVMAWLQAADRIAPAEKGDHTMALDVLSLTTNLDSNDPISTILENARTETPCSNHRWTSTRGLILSTIPDVVQSVESAINATDPRAPGENLSKYYLRYQKSLAHARLVRTFMSKDVGNDWLRPHLEVWARKLGNDEWLMATLALPMTATLNDFYIKVCQAARIFPETINDNTTLTMPEK